MLPISGSLSLSEGASFRHNIQLFDVENDSFDFKEQFDGFESKEVKETTPAITHTSFFYG